MGPGVRPITQGGCDATSENFRVASRVATAGDDPSSVRRVWTVRLRHDTPQVRQLLGDEPQNTTPTGHYSHRLDETIDTAEAYHAKGFNVQFGNDGLVDWIVDFPYALSIIVDGITVPRSWRRAVKALTAAGAQLTDRPDLLLPVWSSEPFAFWLQKGDSGDVWNLAAHWKLEP